MRFLAVLTFLIIAVGVFAQSNPEREELERQLADLEAQIDQHEATIAEYKKQGKTLQGEINNLNATINKINLQIKSITLNLQKLDKEIAVTKGEISDAENKLEINRGALARLIQRLYEDDRSGLIEILLKAPKLSDFFGNMNNILNVQDSLSITVKKVTELRNDLVEKKEVLAVKRSDTAQLKAIQDAQKEAADRAKREKSNLLAQTKGQESKFQSILQETKKSAAQIRNRLFEFIGGGSLTFEKAYDLAKVAERATSMRAAMILAVLDRESALGRNVGQCDYETAMHPKRDLPIFLALLNELKAIGKQPPEPVKVSCPIVSDGAYGGAMGPAQFIPSTWNLYREKITSITGSNPPNPWSHGDAFVATGLYLTDAYNSSSCRNYAEENKNVFPEQFLRERCAAAKYYAGGNWYRYRFLYGDPVVKKADQFQQDINVLGG
jgi:peptidoglycan hydrolase CwlO-like protein